LIWLSIIGLGETLVAGDTEAVWTGEVSGETVGDWPITRHATKVRNMQVRKRDLRVFI
jgi:hypothetical protein